jgi:hypothetical protein
MKNGEIKFSIAKLYGGNKQELTKKQIVSGLMKVASERNDTIDETDIITSLNDLVNEHYLVLESGKYKYK